MARRRSRRNKGELSQEPCLNIFIDQAALAEAPVKTLRASSQAVSLGEVHNVAQSGTTNNVKVFGT